MPEPFASHGLRILGFLVLVVTLGRPAPTCAWQTYFNVPREALRAMVVDASGNVLLGAAILEGIRYRSDSVVKLSGHSGRERWRRRFKDRIFDLAADGSGDVVVVGAARHPDRASDFGVRKWRATTGELAWSYTLDGTSDRPPNPYHPGGSSDAASSISIDPSGDVFAVGTLENRPENSDSGVSDTVVCRLRGSDGTELWRVALDVDPGISLVRGTTLDSNGDLLVVGSHTITKLAGATGMVLWHSYLGAEVLRDFVRTDASGDVVVGTVEEVVGVTKLARATGEPVWRRDLEGVSISGFDVGADGDVFLAGASPWPTSGDIDFTVMRLYGADGRTLWTSLVDGGADEPDFAWSLVVGPNELLTVAGSLTASRTEADFAVLQFDARDGAERSRFVVPRRERVESAEVVAASPDRGFVAGGWVSHRQRYPRRPRFVVVGRDGGS
jgi:outer membrane protein assembly factor BamB